MTQVLGGGKPTTRTSVHFSSETNEWATPQNVFDALHREFGFSLDPCATTENAKCSQFFTQDEDGLSQSWQGHTVFMNPPYGRSIAPWVAKAYQEAKQSGTICVCLIPSRTDTRYWHQFAMRATEIRFVKGRIRFGGSDTGAPFPSAIVVFRPCAQDPDAPRVSTWEMR